MDDASVPFLVVVKEVSIVTGAIWPKLRASSMALTALAPLANVFDFRRQDDLFLALNDFTACLKKLLTCRIAPAELTDLIQYLLHHLAAIVRRISTLLTRVRWTEEERRILNYILDESLR